MVQRSVRPTARLGTAEVFSYHAILDMLARLAASIWDSDRDTWCFLVVNGVAASSAGMARPPSLAACISNLQRRVPLEVD